MKGSGKGGESKEVTIGGKVEDGSTLSIELFQEIKKSLNISKAKMEEMCCLMRKYKVKMAPKVRDKLREIDHLLDQHYITLRVKATETVTVEVEEDITVKRRGRKRSKLGSRTERKEVSVERDITILQNPKRFIDSLI